MAKWASGRLFTEGPQDSKAMSDLYRCAQGRDNKSINLLSDAPTEGPEGTLNHLWDMHFPGNTTWVEEGREGKHVLW